MQIERYWKFLDRLPIWRDYSVTFYVKDINAATELNRELKNYYLNSDQPFVCESIESIEFQDGGAIRIVTTENMKSDLHSHLIFMDSRICEDYIRETIRPTIHKYDLREGQAVLNPKLIYIDFKEEA